MHVMATLMIAQQWEIKISGRFITYSQKIFYNYILKKKSNITKTFMIFVNIVTQADRSIKTIFNKKKNSGCNDNMKMKVVIYIRYVVLENV